MPIVARIHSFGRMAVTADKISGSAANSGSSEDKVEGDIAEVIAEASTISRHRRKESRAGTCSEPKRPLGYR